MTRPNRKPLFILFILGFLLYIPTLFNGFVWDDEEMILNNSQIHSIANWPAFFAGSTFNSGGGGNLAGLYYKPLMTSAFSLIYTFFGPSAPVFHMVQILIHIGNTILLYLILKIILSRYRLDSRLSFLAALIFMVHPINTETVVYLADYQDVMYFLFGALTFYLVLVSKTTRQIFFASTLVLFSLLSKETGAVFATIIFIYLLLFERKKLLPYILGIGVVLAIYSYLRFGVAHIFFNKHGLTEITTIGFVERMINVPLIIFTYLKTFFRPVDLAINQQWIVKTINWPEFWRPMVIDGGFFGLIALTGYSISKRRRELFALWLFFLGWFLMGLGFHLQVFPLDLTVSDRWFYLPMVGLLGMGVVWSTAIKAGKLRTGILIIILGLLPLLAARTFIREFDWRNGLTLYTHDIKISRNAFDLENNLGVELFRAGKIDEAKKHFEESVRLSPKWWTNWNNLGAIAQQEGNYILAQEYYRKSVDNGQYYLAYENLSNIILLNSGPQKSKEFTVSALQRLPQNSRLWLNLALAEYQLQNYSEATAAARQSVMLGANERNYGVYSRLSQNLPLIFQ